MKVNIKENGLQVFYFYPLVLTTAITCIGRNEKEGKLHGWEKILEGNNPVSCLPDKQQH